MKFSISQLLLASAAVATPVSKPNPYAVPEEHKRSMERNLDMVRRASGVSDTTILNYALTLEHLEKNFYKTGLGMFSMEDFTNGGYASRVRTNIEEIHSDEEMHVSTLSGALGSAAVPPCHYDFGLTDVGSFVTTANLLEGIGVTAYLGAAALIADPNYLTIAGAILTIESRHSAYLRDSQLPPESPSPAPFDIPLDIMQVYTLASLFITSCPKAADLGVTPFPYLTLNMPPGSPLKVRSGKWARLDLEKGTTVSEPVHAAFITVQGPMFTKTRIINGGKSVMAYVPEGIAGQNYVVLSKSAKKVTDDNTIAGPAVVPVEATYLYNGFPMPMSSP